MLADIFGKQHPPGLKAITCPKFGRLIFLVNKNGSFWENVLLGFDWVIGCISWTLALLYMLEMGWEVSHWPNETDKNVMNRTRQLGKD